VVGLEGQELYRRSLGEASIGVLTARDWLQIVVPAFAALAVFLLFGLAAEKRARELLVTPRPSLVTMENLDSA